MPRACLTRWVRKSDVALACPATAAGDACLGMDERCCWYCELAYSAE